MIDKLFEGQFSSDWIDGWNQRDIDRILAHYADDFEMSSPAIIKLTGERSGTLKGKVDVGAY